MAICIYDYTDYRKYLDDWLDDPDTMTAKGFASEARCSSALVSQVRNGSRDLDPTKVSAWSRALGHDEDEAKYFVFLVDLESSSRMRRDLASAYIRAVQRFLQAEKVDDARLDVLLHWHYAAILELAHCDRFRGDPEWIATRVTPPITTEQAAEALKRLVEMELLSADETGALVPIRVIATEPTVPLGKASLALEENYLSIFERAGGSLRGARADERHFTAMTISLPSAAIPYLQRRMEEVGKELVAFCDDQTERDRVYQLAFLLFPVSRSTRDDQ